MVGRDAEEERGKVLRFPSPEGQAQGESVGGGQDVAGSSPIADALRRAGLGPGQVQIPFGLSFKVGADGIKVSLVFNTQLAGTVTGFKVSYDDAIPSRKELDELRGG